MKTLRSKFNTIKVTAETKKDYIGELYNNQGLLLRKRVFLSKNQVLNENSPYEMVEVK